MLVETRHLAGGETRRIHLCGPGWREPAGGDQGWRFLPSVAGGAFQLPQEDGSAAHKDRVLVWQLQTHTTSTLQLAEVSAAHGQIGAAVTLELEGHAFADVAFASHPGGDVTVHLLFCDKSAAQLRLPAHAGGGSGRGNAGGGVAHGASGGAHGATILDALHPGSLQQLPLAPQLAALGAPSSLAVVGGYLVVAGASDTVACVPLGAFEGSDPALTVQLNASTSLLQRLVGSLYQPVSRAGVVAALPLADPAGRPLLALAHDSGALRVWAAPPAQALIASQELLPGAAARSLVPRAVVAAGGVPPGELLVVSQLEAPEAPGTATLAACHIRFDGAAGADGSSGGGGGSDALLSRCVLQLPAVGARLLGAQLQGDALHVLAAVPGGETRLMEFGARDGAYRGAAQLLSKGPSAEWGIQQDLWAAALAAFPDATSAEDSVLGQLLVPGQLCRVALREALLFWGAALGQDQVDAASYDQLRVYIRAALLSVAARHPAFSEAQCWHAFFARYCECWQQLHAPLALAAVGGTAWMGVVRGGLMATLLRPATSLEEESGGAAGPAGAHAAVRSCLQAVNGALGAPALRLMARLVTAGVDVEGPLLRGMVDLLVYGPQGGGGADGGKSRTGGGDAARRRMAEWRAARQAALLHVHQALATLGDPVQAISDFADAALLDEEAAVALQGPTAGSQAPHLAAPLGASLCSSVLQASRARCLVAQQLLLLLGVVQRMGRAGDAPLSPEQGAVIRERLVPRLATALRASAMALWLAKTPAACPLGAGGGATSAAVLPAHLEALQLGGPARGSVPGTPRTPGAGAGVPALFGGAAQQAQQQTRPSRQLPQQAVAAHLLRGFCEVHPTEAAGAAAGRVGPAVTALLAYLCSGAGAGDASVLGPPGIEARALHLGWRLFCAREFAGVGALVELAGGRAPADAGLAFLLGISLACRLRGFGGPTAAGDAARRELLDAASGHLFRAAAGLAAPEAAPLRSVLQQLRRRQHRGGGSGGGKLDLAPLSGGGGGGSSGGLPDGVPPEAVPRLRLEFFEAVMRLFESEECLEGALEFARAALGAVEGAYGGEEPARRERQGLLWLAVFTYASRLGRYTDAYTAAAANPVPAHRLECVRRLVHRLAEERRLDVLCGLPFAGVVSPEPSASDCAPQPVPLVRVATDVLTRRALHSTVVAGPAGRGPGHHSTAHEALFDFLVAWGDQKGAAAAMLGLAWRLRAEAPESDDVLREVEAAYGAAVNQLELLDPSDAWLDTAHPLLADCAPSRDAADDGDGAGPAPGPGDDEVSLADGMVDGGDDDDGGAGDPPSLRHGARRQQRRYLGGGGGGGAADSAAADGVVTLAALRREAALFSAAAALSGSLPGLQVLRPPGLAPDYAYDQVLGAGALDEAEALAHALWRGGDLEERLERLAGAAAAHCVRSQAGQGAAGGEAAGSGWEGGGAGGGAQLAYLGSPAAGGWQRLRALLARYEGADRRRLAGLLRVAAVDAALSEAPGASLPAWLLAPFAPAGGGGGGMAGGPSDPAALLRVYLRHGRLEDAAELALEHLAAWGATNPLTRCKPAAVWVPLRALEVLDARLGDAAQQQAGQQQQEGQLRRLGDLKAKLRAAVGQHLELASRDSRMARDTAGGAATGMAIG